MGVMVKDTVCLEHKEDTLEYLPKNTIPRVKHGGGSISPRGCFCSAGTEAAVKMKEIMDTFEYQTVSASGGEAKYHFPAQYPPKSK